MKRLIIISVLITTLFSAKAQDEIDSVLAVQLIELADGIVEFSKT